VWPFRFSPQPFKNFLTLLSLIYHFSTAFLVVTNSPQISFTLGIKSACFI
jgi:hypothetical protein